MFSELPATPPTPRRSSTRAPEPADCELVETPEGFWCAVCDPEKQHLLPRRMPRNCRGRPRRSGEWRVVSGEQEEKAHHSSLTTHHSPDPKCTCQLRDAAERWIAAGKPNVSDAEAETRLAACKACQHWARYGERLALSIRMATLRCPLGKWDIRAIPRTQFVSTAQRPPSGMRQVRPLGPHLAQRDSRGPVARRARAPSGRRSRSGRR
jgi:hypothetical protein